MKNKKITYDELKNLSIDTSDLMAKTSNNHQEYLQAITEILNTVDKTAEGVWHTAKNALLAAQDKWQEKIIKTVYKQTTGETYKPYQLDMEQEIDED